MKYLSVCSGIASTTVAWKPLGFEPVGFSEIDNFPRAVLKYHYPDVPLFGDFTKIKESDANGSDILVGGTPCQSFSIAGLRGGMDDDRGNLALEFCRLAARTRPRWIVWENVPGVLSSNGGRDFGAFLGGLAECGYGFAYRVLDAQFVRVQSHAFAVPQRRRRVFVVGYLGDWRRAAAVLFERESLRRNPPPRREARKDVAGTISSRTTGGGGLGTDFDLAGGTVSCTLPSSDGGVSSGMHPVVAGTMSDVGGRARPGDTPDTADTYLVAIQERAVSDNANAGADGAGVRDDGAAYTIEARQTPQAVAFNARQDPDSWTEKTGPIDSDVTSQAVAFQKRIGRNGRGYSDDGTVGTLAGAEAGATSDMRPCVAFDTTQITNSHNKSVPQPVCHTLAEGQHPPSMVSPTMQVRRLTPQECERLQGFPDSYTLVPYRGKPAKDGPRYKAIGNSMPVNVMSWIGRRLQEVDRRKAPTGEST